MQNLRITIWVEDNADVSIRRQFTDVLAAEAGMRAMVEKAEAMQKGGEQTNV